MSNSLRGWVGWTIAVSTFVFASHPHIRDPKKILEQVEKFIGNGKFEDVYKCGVQFTFERVPCALRC